MDDAAGRIRDLSFGDLDAPTLYALLRLRVDVFVVEQECPYGELDGRDAEPGTRHVWVDTGAGPAAYLRVLAEPDGSNRIGRVATRPARRGLGLATDLLDHVHRTTAGRIVLDAQAHLEAWYTRLGYTTTGPGFDEDGIAHVPMERRG